MFFSLDFVLIILPIPIFWEGGPQSQQRVEKVYSLMKAGLENTSINEWPVLASYWCNGYSPPPMFIDYCLFSVYVLLSREWGWQQSAGSLSAPSHSSLQRVLSPLLQFPDIGPIKVLHAPNIPCQGNAGACTLFVPRPTWRGLALSCRGPDLQDLAGGAGWATVIAVSLTWAVIFLPQVTASPISYSVSDRCHPCTVPLSAWIS